VNRTSSLIALGLALLVAFLALTARRPKADARQAAPNAAPNQQAQRPAEPANTGFFALKHKYVLTG
jgi:hypothetical protein